MCIQIKTIFRCNCPHQNTLLCPHHIYVRETLEQVEKEGKYAENGFQLRLESALQAHKDWTPSQQDEQDAPYPTWEHCSVYKARHQTDAGEVKSGKERELTCPNWIQNQESFSRLVRGLCSECVDGHGVRKPSPVKGRFVEEIEVEVDVDVVKTEIEIRPSKPTSLKGISQQTPLRKVLSQAKQKVIRHNLGVQGSGNGESGRRVSTPVRTAGGTSPDLSSESRGKEKSESSSIGKGKGKGKELPDVFARLLIGTGSPKRQGSGNSGTNTPTPVKRPVSRQTKGAGRGGK